MQRFRSSPKRSRSVKLLLVGAALALTASACGSGTSETEAGSPIAEFLGQDDFLDFEADPEGAQAQFAEEERVREEAVAACMKREGFDYLPMDSSDFSFFEAGDEELDYDSREYAVKYGFGITTEWFSQEEVGPDLVGHNYSDFDAEEQMMQDPNMELVEAMDESTQEAYYEALYGAEDSFPSFDPETMTDEELEAIEDEFVYEPQGCQGEAWSEGDSGKANKFYQDFSSELQEMYESIEDDPRIKAKESEISECVAGKGFEFTSFNEDLWSSYEDEMEQIESMIGGFPGEDMTEEEFATMTPEQMDELFNKPREFTPEAKALLGELQARETSTAVAVWDCGGSFSVTGEIYQEVVQEYERQFLADNADQLAEYKAED